MPSWIRQTLLTLAFAAPLGLLTACGGGGGGSLFEGETDDGDAELILSAGTTQLPVQTGSTLVEPISPLYTTTIIAKATGADGRPLATGTPITFVMDGGNTFSGALYPQPFETEETTNPDGSTTTIKKPFWSYSVESASGQALILFHAWNRPGTVNITASFIDPTTNTTIAKTISIVVGSPIASGMPSTITHTVANAPIFVANQGKNDTALVDIVLTDPSGQPINNPSSPNVRVELLNPEIGATLLGVNGEQGSIVNSITINGKAEISVKAGTTAGTARLRITADAADNNVENGIQQAIVDDVSISISDGRVAALAFTGAYANAIITNETTLPLGNGESLQDGTYLRVLSVIATDNLGNPVANTEIKFSLIDSPITDYPLSAGTFTMAGNNGDPSEGGNRFTAAGAQFQSWGVHANDRLVLTPNEQGLDRLLIGSRIISQVESQTSLLVTLPFSANNGRNGGAVIPWTIGRAQYGVIGASAITNEQGVASTFITYPVSRINQRALIVAEADNGIANFMDASYVGIRDLKLTSSHTEVPANTTTSVTLCLKDANDVPLSGHTISVGGLLADKVTLNPSTLITGANGCVTFSIIARNQDAGSADIPLTFSVGTGETEKVEVVVRGPGQGDMLVSVGAQSPTNPDDPADPNRTRDITVTLVDENGTAIPGQIITGTGDATDADDTSPHLAAIISISQGTTGSNGVATINVKYTGDTGDSYTVDLKAQGGATASVTFPY